VDMGWGVVYAPAVNASVTLNICSFSPYVMKSIDYLIEDSLIEVISKEMKNFPECITLSQRGTIVEGKPDPSVLLLVTIDNDILLFCKHMCKRLAKVLHWDHLYESIDAVKNANALCALFAKECDVNQVSKDIAILAGGGADPICTVLKLFMLCVKLSDDTDYLVEEILYMISMRSKLLSEMPAQSLLCNLYLVLYEKYVSNLIDDIENFEKVWFKSMLKNSPIAQFTHLKEKLEGHFGLDISPVDQINNFGDFIQLLCNFIDMPLAYAPDLYINKSGFVNLFCAMEYDVTENSQNFLNGAVFGKKNVNNKFDWGKSKGYGEYSAPKAFPVFGNKENSFEKKDIQINKLPNKKVERVDKVPVEGQAKGPKVKNGFGGFGLCK